MQEENFGVPSRKTDPEYEIMTIFLNLSSLYTQKNYSEIVLL